jgi:hypothetical protein
MTVEFVVVYKIYQLEFDRLRRDGTHYLRLNRNRTFIH